ncbi:hypothetical protein [Kutzneria sp. NPDC052558]|uniref:hypothetical protein n=1 Tax=Kutzneria sp. NPDC052558 TaxID=3364121 RepID=UPI0037C7E885
MRRKVLLVGVAVLAIGLGGAGFALAADTGATPVTLTPVAGKPDVSKVKEGVAVPVGPIGGVVGGAPDQVTQAK